MPIHKRGTSVYEIDGTCYYVTSMQDKSISKLEDGPKKDRYIKKVAYTSGQPGEEVASPEGDGRVAVVVESKSDEAVEEAPVVEPPTGDPVEPMGDPLVPKGDALTLLNPTEGDPS